MLCNTTDVVMEGSLTLTPELEEKIKYKIEKLSLYLRKISPYDLDKEEYKFYAQRACLYGCLGWLESKRLIPPSSVVSVHEGNISIVYKSTFSDSVEHHSYDNMYNHYMAFILLRPPVGASI